MNLAKTAVPFPSLQHTRARLGAKSGARPATPQQLQSHVEHQNKGTHEDDTNAPHVSLAWIIATASEDLGC